VCRRNRLQQHQADILGLHVLAAPVIEVVLQIAVTDTELELRQCLLVAKQVECIENVEVKLGGRTKGS
jgi:hypothetical protein